MLPDVEGQALSRRWVPVAAHSSTPSGRQDISSTSEEPHHPVELHQHRAERDEHPAEHERAEDAVEEHPVLSRGARHLLFSEFV